MNGIGGSCNSATSGAVVVAATPADVFGVGERWVYVHGYGYAALGGANTFHCHPRTTFARSAGAILANSATVATNTLAETGIVGADAADRFTKVADPLDANKRAFLMRIKSTDTGPVSGVRAEIQFGGTTERLTFGTRWFVGFSVLIPTEWKDGAASGVGNTASGADEILLWQIHHSQDGGDTENNPPIALIFVAGGGSEAACKLRMTAAYNVNAVTLSGDTVPRTVLDETGPTLGAWHHYCVDIVPHWDAGESPHLIVHRAIGSGATQTIVNDSLPNQYNDVTSPYTAQDVYYYATTGAWSGGRTDWTAHSKGLYIWRHNDGVVAEDVIEFLKAI